MRHVHSAGTNVLKRLLIRTTGFNLALLMRQLIRVRTSRGLHGPHLTIAETARALGASPQGHVSRHREACTMWAHSIERVGDDRGGNLPRPHPLPGFHVVASGRLPNELHGPDSVRSTEQQLVHAEWEALTSCEKEGRSCSRENRIVKWRLDS